MQLKLTAPMSLDREELVKQTIADPELLSLIRAIEKGAVTNMGYKFEEGMLFKNDRLVIPQRTSFIPTLLEQFHSYNIGRHEGELKTFKHLSRERCDGILFQMLDLSTKQVFYIWETEMLVKWKWLPLFEASWEPIHRLVCQYPTFCYEDKVNLLRGGGGVRKVISSLSIHS